MHLSSLYRGVSPADLALDYRDGEVGTGALLVAAQCMGSQWNVRWDVRADEWVSMALYAVNACR